MDIYGRHLSLDRLSLVYLVLFCTWSEKTTSSRASYLRHEASANPRHEITWTKNVNSKHAPHLQKTFQEMTSSIFPLLTHISIWELERLEPIMFQCRPRPSVPRDLLCDLMNQLPWAILKNGQLYQCLLQNLGLAAQEPSPKIWKNEGKNGLVQWDNSTWGWV